MGGWGIVGIGTYPLYPPYQTPYQPLWVALFAFNCLIPLFGVFAVLMLQTVSPDGVLVFTAVLALEALRS